MQYLLTEITKLYDSELILTIIKWDIKLIYISNINNYLFIKNRENMNKIVDYQEKNLIV